MKENKIKPPKDGISATELFFALLCLGTLSWIFYSDCYEQIPILIHLSAGISVVIALLYLQEKLKERKLKKYYSVLANKYKRVEIGIDNQVIDENANFKTENIGLEINLIYQGGDEFKIIAQYWKSSRGVVEATIEFNERNRMVANGKYVYTDGVGLKGDSGIYTIYRMENDNPKLLVLYQRLFPRGNGITDKNEGWEIWEHK